MTGFSTASTGSGTANALMPYYIARSGIGDSTLNMPKQLRDKPLTQDLVSGMNEIVRFRQGYVAADGRDQGHRNALKPRETVTANTPGSTDSCR